MQAARSEKLVRKQFLIHPRQIKKLAELARVEEASAAEVVRKAIDAYDPDFSMDSGEKALLELVSARVKDAIVETRETRLSLQKTLAKIKGRHEEAR